jgi:mannose/cellobiose epimerase-like protein (N-acyl-D-glucosamine 2-epimerase family)
MPHGHDGVPNLKPWLFQTVLPFWAETGRDRDHGGFVERLTLDRKPAPDDYKRVLVQARQTAVFSHAHLLGAPPYALAAAEEGFRFLNAHYWDDDTGGWMHTVTRAGAPRDRRKDAYDQAFVLFALAWYHRATGDTRALPLARRTLTFMEERLADDLHGGFHERLDEDGPHGLPRRQNPHMHLLEALLELYEASGEPGWIARAGEMLQLFRARFYDPETGTVGEFFTHDWRPAPDGEGAVREPGHHFEWVWLLLHYRRLAGDAQVLEPAERLYHFARRHGFDKPGGSGRPAVVIDRVDPFGAVISANKRFWPQAEAIRAFLARATELGDGGDRERAAQLLARLFTHYLSPSDPAWREWLDRDGKEISVTIPATSLYHLFGCVADALRVLPG